MREYAVFDLYLNANLALGMARTTGLCKSNSDTNKFLSKFIEKKLKHLSANSSIRKQVKQDLKKHKTKKADLENITLTVMDDIKNASHTFGPNSLINLISKLTNGGWQCRKASENDVKATYNAEAGDFILISEQLDKAFDGYHLKNGVELEFVCHGNEQEAINIALQLGILLKPVKDMTFLFGVKTTVLQLVHIS